MGKQRENEWDVHVIPQLHEHRLGEEAKGTAADEGKTETDLVELANNCLVTTDNGLLKDTYPPSLL